MICYCFYNNKFLIFLLIKNKNYILKELCYSFILSIKVVVISFFIKNNKN